MKILAIETSCDETAIAIVEADKGGTKRGLTPIKFNILSNIVSSQVKVHRKWGGVVPTLAKREHQKNLVPVLIRALRKAKLLKKLKVKNEKLKITIKNLKLKQILRREEHLYKKLKKFLVYYQKPKIDSIATTIGPGLEPALWVGVNFVRALSYFWQLPIIPVNHIEGHIFANFIGEKTKVHQKGIFPAICLSVAGGHTQLILIKDIGKYRLLGETRDDAAGECFDKVARILGLGYPGGPAIARAAKRYTGPTRAILPRPMIRQKNYDFSFSGLKTAVLYNYKNQPEKVKKSKEYIQAMARETQQAIIDVLIKKTLRAVKDYNVKTIFLSGGVAANDELRKQFQLAIHNQQSAINFLVPPKILCTDNAAMVATTAYFHQKEATKSWQEIKADANLRI